MFIIILLLQRKVQVILLSAMTKNAAFVDWQDEIDEVVWDLEKAFM